MANCTVCGVKVDPEGDHRFTNDQHPSAGKTKITEQYCNKHCPRCNPPKENT